MVLRVLVNRTNLVCAKHATFAFFLNSSLSANNHIQLIDMLTEKCHVNVCPKQLKIIEENAFISVIKANI